MTKVVIVAIDGLQPAQVTAGYAPNLAAFAAGGVTFANHHSVYPTVTRTNVASMTTGRLPGGHGLHGNALVVRDFDPDRAIPALLPELGSVEKKTGKVLLAPSLAEILAEHGKRYVAVTSGSSGNAFLHHPNIASPGGATIHPEFARPNALHSEVEQAAGPWPEEGKPNSRRISHAFRVLKEHVIQRMEPAVALVWSSDPDGTQHVSGVGSADSDRSLAHVDTQFGRLVEWLEETGRARDADVVVVSDHGYSTVREPVKIEGLVRQAGFPGGGRPGGVIVAPNGGSVLFYVNNRNPATAERLARWLMGHRWCGALLASDAVGPIEGTVLASVAGLDGERSPELTMSFAWDSTPNDAGFAGHAYNGGGAAGLGMHGSMSPHETRCVLLARGPSFRERTTVTAPSGNIDLTPTLLALLGVKAPGPMDGRVLSEAFRDGPEPPTVTSEGEVFEAERSLGGESYRQSISVSQVGSATYVDEGNRME